LLSGHSIVLQELQRVLGTASFAVKPLKIGENQETGNPQSLPTSEVYVIDAESISGKLEDLIREIIKTSPEAQMMVLADKLTQTNTFPLLNLGVKGLITHDVIEQQLGRALDAIASGGYWVPRTLLASFVDSVITRSRRTEQARPTEIEVSRREKDIVDGLLLNLSNKEIANKLNISERTVKFHVSNLLNKFNVQRRADLILLWYQQAAQDAADSASKRVH
jgi:DNA-binding NarL/FixJ family response regulator